MFPSLSSLKSAVGLKPAIKNQDDYKKKKVSFCEKHSKNLDSDDAERELKKLEKLEGLRKYAQSYEKFEENRLDKGPSSWCYEHTNKSREKKEIEDSADKEEAKCSAIREKISKNEYKLSKEHVEEIENETNWHEIDECDGAEKKYEKLHADQTTGSGGGCPVPLRCAIIMVFLILIIILFVYLMSPCDMNGGQPIMFSQRGR